MHDVPSRWRALEHEPVCKHSGTSRGKSILCEVHKRIFAEDPGQVTCELPDRNHMCLVHTAASSVLKSTNSDCDRMYQSAMLPVDAMTRPSLASHPRTLARMLHVAQTRQHGRVSYVTMLTMGLGGAAGVPRTRRSLGIRMCNRLTERPLSAKMQRCSPSKARLRQHRSRTNLAQRDQRELHASQQSPRRLML
jgi:hypothetical protein